MSIYLYLSLIPESLVGSMLEPERFGTYLATGTQKCSHGEAIYFDLKSDFRSEYFDLKSLPERCVAHPSGRPKHSLYLAIYRVLEQVPLEAIKSLWLATRDGRVLELKQATGGAPELGGKYHLYQELCPVHPLIVSTLEPGGFCRFMTDPSRPVRVPKVCFVDMDLADLAEDPMTARTRYLPYANFDHLRQCLAQLSGQEGKPTKTVNRTQPLELPYRCIKSGFYVGDAERVLYFPFPSHGELDAEWHDWWRSANV